MSCESCGDELWSGTGVLEFAGVSCKLMQSLWIKPPSGNLMHLPFLNLHIKNASYTYIIQTREILEMSQLKLIVMAAENNNR